jgi:hypothetical protein
MSREALIDANHLWGTINCNAVGPRGEICGVTTTSGLALEDSRARRRLAGSRGRVVRAAGCRGRRIHGAR